MKILHIATGYPVTFNGGITNYVRTLATDQVEGGNDVTVLSAPLPEGARVPFKVVEHRSRALRPFSLKYVEHDPAADRILDLITQERFDIVHFHMGLDLAMEFYGRLPDTGIPYIVSVHDYYLACPRIVMIDDRDTVHREVNLDECARCVGVLHQVDVLEKGRRLAGVALPRVRSRNVYRRAETMRKFLKQARAVLPVSRRVEEILRSFEPEARYSVVHIGNKTASQPMPEHVDGGVIRCTVLGMMSHHKGANVLRSILESVRRPDLEFHFYGRGDKKLLSELERLGLVCHGSYTPADLPDIMAQTDVGLVLPIWEDNAPQVVMEFLNSGVPVFATRMGGIPDFVNESNGVLFDPYSPKETAEFHERLCRLSAEELAAFRARITQLKTPARHCTEIDEIYASVLAGIARV